MYNQILEANNHVSAKRSNRNPPGKSATIIKETPDPDVQEKMYQSMGIEKTTFKFLLNDSKFRSEAESIESVLVKTGVFQGCEKTLEEVTDDLVYFHKDMIIDASLRKPDYLSDNVADAVKLIYEKEKFC